MSAGQEILFPPFRLDSGNECLWRGSQRITPRRKTFAVLRYLAERPGQLVTKEELLTALWPGVYVTDTVLKVCLRELRAALGDAVKAPRFVETVHGRGYRFIAPLSTTASLQGSGGRDRSESYGMKSHAGLRIQCLPRTLVPEPRPPSSWVENLNWHNCTVG